MQGGLVPPTLAEGKNTCYSCVEKPASTLISDRYRTVIGLQGCKFKITKCYKN